MRGSECARRWALSFYWFDKYSVKAGEFCQENRSVLLERSTQVSLKHFFFQSLVQETYVSNPITRDNLIMAMPLGIAFVTFVHCLWPFSTSERTGEMCFLLDQ